MKKLRTLALGCALIAASTEATCAQNSIINIDATTNGDPSIPIGTPLSNFFGAGVYRCTIVCPSNCSGARYYEWSRSVSDRRWPCTTYWIWSADKSWSSGGGEWWVGYNGTNQKTNSFCLNKDSVLIFGVPDNVLYDNAGGVSLLLEYLNPILDIGIEKTNIVLSWPSSAFGWQLERINSLAPGAQWTPVTNSPLVLSERNFVTNALEGTANFYRLRK